MQRKPIVVTGGSGFVATYVLRRLASLGVPAVSLDIREHSSELMWLLSSCSRHVDTRHASVTDRRAIAGALSGVQSQVLIHAASIVDPKALAKDPTRALEVNTRGTINVLEAARDAAIPTVIILSSIATLPTVQWEPITTDHPTILASEGPGGGFYGASKLAAEAFALTYAEAFDMDVHIVRPSAVYGFGMQLPLFIKDLVEASVARRNLHLRTGGRVKRDYTHVSDVAELLVRLAQGQRNGCRVHYAATGRPPIEASEIPGLIRKCIPDANVSIGRQMTSEDIRENRFRGQLDITRSRVGLGWEPQYEDLGSGISEYIRTLIRYEAARESA